tara:strand:+ start:355 stop:558 length:204 start_codon:yes stop_codon:yes gene_type:complete
MTLEQFYTNYAATENNTEGFCPSQLDALNGLVWSRLRDYDVEDYDTDNAAKDAFDRYSSHYLVATAS